MTTTKGRAPGYGRPPRFNELGWLLCPGCQDGWLHQARAHTSDNSTSLEFWCEQCDDISRLTIEQYKGNTMVVWHFVGASPYYAEENGPPERAVEPVRASHW